MTERIKNFFQTTPIARFIGSIVLVIGIIVIALLIFLLGESFGYHRAQFSYRMADGYEHVFGGGPGSLPLPDDNAFAESHGASGTVIKAALPDIIVSDNDGVEKTVLLNNQTVIREFRGGAASSSLKVGDQIIVIGSPDTQGRIVASLVRIVPTATSTNN